MDFEKLADLLFPDVTMTPDEIQAKYPARNLPEGAKVTRFAPSPTGYVHLGGFYQAILGEILARQSGGVFYLRIEDTDSKREVEGAAQALINTLSHYGVHFNEGVTVDGETGIYGPYTQSKRVGIYHVFAKELVKKGLAYPVFTTAEELEELNKTDKKEENKNKDWLAEAELREKEKQKARSVTLESVKENLASNNPFVLRILADGDPNVKIPFTDLIKGKLEIPENNEDFVLLKSDGVPTYHFAHAVDDHLMGTTHVIRGEEWLPSLAKHLMLFKYLGFKPPKYLHTATIMRLDENGNKKKLSKRDMGASMADYKSMGYAPECVMEYMLTILNSNFEEWRAQNLDKSYKDFPFSIKKMSTSGALFDINKLNDVSKNVVSRMSAETVYSRILEWAGEFDRDFADKLNADKEYALKILSIGRGGKKPRKDYGKWQEAKDYMSLFYDEYFELIDRYPDNFDKNDIKSALTMFLDTFDYNDDQNVWFEKIKNISDSLGYASDMKAYKENPENYKGNVGDVSMFIRIAVTGKTNSPDMYTIMQILGKDKVQKRIKNMLERL